MPALHSIDCWSKGHILPETTKKPFYTSNMTFSEISYSATGLLVNYYRSQGKVVVWVSPPLQPGRLEAPYILLEKAVTRNGLCDKKTFFVYNIASDMAKDGLVGKTKYINNLEENIHHLSKEITVAIIRKVFKYVLKEPFRLQNGIKIKDVIRKEDYFKTSMCSSCGSESHDHRSCIAKVYCKQCKKAGHSTEMCLVQFRMFKWCGQTGNHPRAPCPGWWH